MNKIESKACLMALTGKVDEAKKLLIKNGYDVPQKEEEYEVKAICSKCGCDKLIPLPTGRKRRN